jgi:methyltransferase
MVTTRTAFLVLVALVALQRLAEVRRSRRHAQALRARGAIEHAAWQVPIMAGLHGAWLAGTALEVWFLAPPFRASWAIAALLLLALGQGLRLAAMRTLGERWTIRVLTLPATPPIVTGPYRHIRHPNYLGVVLEIAALPLVHGAVYSAVCFSLANAVLLVLRIRVENRALAS